MSEDRLEQILNEMKEESVRAEELAGAKARVWEKLSAAVTSACGEFRPEIAPYLAGGLTEQRRLLLEDHLSRCAECRRVYAQAKGERKVVAMPTTRRPVIGTWARWAIAAGLAVVGLYLGRDRIDSALAPGGTRASVESLSGTLYRASAATIDRGATLSEGEVVRTGAGARAVLRLTDGSLVEVNERTELSLRAAWSGESIYLERGDVIVQAAKQRRGHLRVITRDSVVSVKGTVFAVSSGSAGSLVSVVEGSVQVEQAGSERLLKPGQQAASNQALATVPVKEAVAWSQDAVKYLAVLGELVKIEKQLTAPDLRTQARLLAYLPAAPMMYGAIPNLGGTIKQAMTLMEQRASENATLREWWTSESGQELKKVLDKVQTLTPLLGDEIVFVMTKDPANTRNQIPLMLAEVKAGQQEALKQAIDQLGAGAVYQIVQNLLVVSDTQAHLTAMIAQLGRGATSPFAAEIAQRYQRGTGWLFGVDITAVDWKAPEGEVADAIGFTQMKHVFFEQRTAQGVDDNSAVVTFKGARTGMASWLAAPAAAGSAEYASSEAVLAVSASTKNPRQAFEEMLALLSKNSVKAVDGLREFEVKTGVNFGNEIAAALGTDFTVVLEKPTLPIPEWVVAVEVSQPALIDGAVKKLVEAVNHELKPDQQQNKLSLTQETVNGRMYTSVKSASSPTTLTWAYDRNYLVASTDRAQVARAIATREGGFPLVRSEKFRQQMPGAGTVHYSGFFWLNTHGVLAGFSGMVDNPTLKAMMENQDPVLVILNGETERIQAASRTRLTSLVLDLMMAGGQARAKNAARL
jgi:hypothetical protein